MLRRQRQYFEQKKRQQQSPGVQSQVDVSGTGSQACHDQAPRSLDVINLNNLATPISHSSGPESEFLYMFCGVILVVVNLFYMHFLHLIFPVLPGHFLDMFLSGRLTNGTLVQV